ncbi:hypothetical protein ACFWB2_14765 [Streptomyces virginiae]|uniref:hypothetical protein n=1 Tax=Streptomyces TaxID=1883 RepID=UPI00093D95FE|nr:hypothetical protein [Streptomyces sp. MJM1172]OKI67578.1 hypothetical protein AMK15_06320 [Streptomyces sp. MJM1172]
MIPEEGALVHDEGTERVAEVEFVDGDNVVLCARGQYWVADAKELRPAGVLDQLRAQVIAINERGRA